MNLMNYSKVPCYLFLMITFLFRLKTDRKPWITTGILTSIRAKRRLEKKARSNPDRYLTIYRSHKNFLTKVARATREQYYRTLLETYISNSKKIWSNINCILGKKHSSINTTLNSMAFMLLSLKQLQMRSISF